MEGIVFIGTVVGRTRRYSEYDGVRKEIVTYHVRANERDTYITHFEPKDYYPVTSDTVQIPIYARAYISRNGGAKVSYCVVSEDDGFRGESF